MTRTIPASDMRRLLAHLPVNRLLSAWDLSYVVVVTAVIDAVRGDTGATRVLTVVLLAVSVYAVLGHLLSVLTSRRLR